MLFTTQKFLFFFLVVFAAYWALPWRRPRVWVLLAASYYFYASWNASLARLIFLTTVCDYFIARGIDASAVPWRRRALMLLSVVGNLSVLCYFKYANFFLRSLEEALAAAGASTSLPVLSVILPVGISFYTFEAISYTVDVFLGKIRAERNLDHFLLFILFFPHLVAGPIVRASDFLPQVNRPKRLSWPRFAVGSRLVLLGLFKKMVVADRMALLVDPVFADPAHFESSVVWMAAVAYSIQIYCDFSGYSDIALGTARLLGYRLVVNFDMPFASPNVSELWRRWHISLSSWIRDYVYIPLGGNRGTVLRSCFNVLFAMTLCGLWHGAAWTFVAWGALNGMYLIVHRLFRWATRDLTGVHVVLESAPGTAFRIALTFTAFTLAMVIFRSPTFETAGAMFDRLIVPADGAGPPVPAVTFWTFAGLVLLAHAVAASRENWVRWAQLSPAIRGLGWAGVLFLTLVLTPVKTWTFIYFQF